MTKYWEFYFLSVIKGEKRGIVPAALRFLLLLFSFPYCGIVALRNWLFDKGWLKSYIPPVPLVISVGNITAGGTGKTPVTLMIAQELYNKVPLAILSRGYRSLAEKASSPLLLHKKQGLLHPASLCGDEPFLLAENLPEAYVIVGRDRFQSSKLAARVGAEAIIMDDGMQHRAIARDLEVVVIDLLDSFGQGYFLPRGLLRESRKALARADLVVLNHSEDHALYEQTKRRISHATSAPVIGTRLEVTGVFDFKEQPLPISAETRVGIFCGIAHPEYFRTTVRQLGGDVVHEWFLPDHEALNLEELSAFSLRCHSLGAACILCTEKDRVKITDPGELKIPVGWVKTKLHIVEGEEHWKVFMEQAKKFLS
jgi:tetraacyldisaccharide 4'-kinase